MKELNIKGARDVNKVLVYGFDSTELHELNQNLEEKVEEKTANLLNVLEGTNAGVWYWDFETNTVEVNERWASLIGYELKDIKPITYDFWKKKTLKAGMTWS